MLRLALVEPGISYFGSANPSSFLRILKPLNESSNRLAESLERGTLEPLGFVPDDVESALAGRIAPGPDAAQTLRNSAGDRDLSYADFWPEKDSNEFHLVDELEEGRDYYVVVTIESGLYRYAMNDVVRMVGRFGATPTLKFIQKGRGFISITGERLYEGQLLQAVRAEVEKLGLGLNS